MKAAVYMGIDKIEVCDVPRPEVGPCQSAADTGP